MRLSIFFSLLLVLTVPIDSTVASVSHHRSHSRQSHLLPTPSSRIHSHSSATSIATHELHLLDEVQRLEKAVHRLERLVDDDDDRFVTSEDETESQFSNFDDTATVTVSSDDGMAIAKSNRAASFSSASPVARSTKPTVAAGVTVAPDVEFILMWAASLTTTNVEMANAAALANLISTTEGISETFFNQSAAPVPVKLGPVDADLAVDVTDRSLELAVTVASYAVSQRTYFNFNSTILQDEVMAAMNGKWSTPEPFPASGKAEDMGFYSLLHLRTISESFQQFAESHHVYAPGSQSVGLTLPHLFQNQTLYQEYIKTMNSTPYVDLAASSVGVGDFAARYASQFYLIGLYGNLDDLSSIMAKWQTRFQFIGVGYALTSIFQWVKDSADGNFAQQSLLQLNFYASEKLGEWEFMDKQIGTAETTLDSTKTVYGLAVQEWLDSDNGPKRYGYRSNIEPSNQADGPEKE